MKITTKELKLQPGKIIQNVAAGNEVIVTFRGQEAAKIVPIEPAHASKPIKNSIFGMWKNDSKTQNVDKFVRNMRKPRDLC